MMAASPTVAAELSGASTPAVVERHIFVVRVDPRTGKLVRRELVPMLPKPGKGPPEAIANLVDRNAKVYGVDPLLVHSVIQVESNYDPNAVSPKGAEGLMQLMPQTSRMLGVNNSFDPGENIEAGVRYLKYLQDLYKDNRLALAAYNAGPGAVEKFKMIPPYRETRNYVEKVGQKYDQAKAGAKAQPASAKSPDAALLSPISNDETRFPKLEQFVDEHGRLHLQTAP